MPHSDYAPMNAAELMDRVFDVYKKSFAKQLSFSAIVGVLSFIAMVILGFVAALAVILPNINNTDGVYVFILATIVAAMLPVYWIWTATADAGHILLSKQAFYNEQVKLPIRKLPRTVLRVLGASLAQMILSVPWLLLVFAIMFLAMNPTGADILTSLMSFISTKVWIAISIGSAFLYVVYSNVFALAIPCSVFEPVTFFKAITRSWHLIKGEFWKILGIRILWSIVIYLFSYSAQGLWALIMGIVTSLSNSTIGAITIMTTLGSLLQSLITIAIGFLIGPLSGILTALLYFNQRIKKEGLDIEIELALLDAAL